MIRLENWHARRTGTVYQAPEMSELELVGTVEGHPRYPDGKVVITSPVRGSDGRVVFTRSGSSYRLGEIEPGYRKFLEANGISFDPEHPIASRVEVEDTHA